MSFTYITAGRGKLSNDPYEITKEDIEFMLLENAHDEEECRKVTESSYKGESYYDDDRSNDFFFQFTKEILYRDTKTSGFIMQYPHGTIIKQAERNHFYRGENKIYSESVSSIYRKPNDFVITEKINSNIEIALYKLLADMRVAEFKNFLQKFEIVQQWEDKFTLLYEPLAQHYGIKTRWLDITNDFKVALFFACCYWDSDKQYWLPLTKKQTEKNDSSKYGVIFHIPRINANLALSAYITDNPFNNPKKYNIKKNVILPIGFQPFRRCDAQTGYGIYMKIPFPLQKDISFEKLFFRHDEKLSQWIYDEMAQGDKIYPQEGLNSFLDVIKNINNTNIFSEKAFHYGVNCGDVFKDELDAKKNLSYVRLDNSPIEIKKSGELKFSATRQRIRQFNRQNKELDFQRACEIFSVN